MVKATKLKSGALRPSTAWSPDRIKRLMDRLQEVYPHAECSLEYKNPFQLLVTTILSAQCTDVRVNKVTPALFSRYPDAASLSKAPMEEIERLIASTGFYRNKAKSLKGASTNIIENYGGKVPQTMEDLSNLPGVGRKTANVVLGNAFRKAAGVVVDTHVKRIAYRLGLTAQTDPIKVERDLNEKLPEKYWIDFPHWIIHHGRQICKARKPDCKICPLVDLCDRKGLQRL